MVASSVLITGASRGIGLEFVRQLLAGAAPASVLAACRNPEGAEELQALAAAHPERLHLLALDVNSDESIAAACQKATTILGDGGLGLLINNAGILDSTGAKVPDVQRESLRRHFETNTIAPLMVTQTFLPLLRRHGGGATVVNVSSGGGSIGNLNPMIKTVIGCAYPASKKFRKLLQIHGGPARRVVNISSGYASIGEFNSHVNERCGFSYPASKQFTGLLKLAKPHGLVVHISSTLGSMGAFLNGYDKTGFPYPASKAALNMVSRILSDVMKDDNIVCVSMCPGHVATDMGGPKGIPKTESVAAMLGTIAALGPKDSGRFLRRDNTDIPF